MWIAWMSSEMVKLEFLCVELLSPGEEYDHVPNEENTKNMLVRSV